MEHIFEKLLTDAKNVDSSTAVRFWKTKTVIVLPEAQGLQYSAPGCMFLNSRLARVFLHVLARVFLHVLARAFLHVLAHISQQFGLARVFLHVLAHVFLHVLARVFLHVLARVFLHMLACVLLHVHV